MGDFDRDLREMLIRGRGAKIEVATERAPQSDQEAYIKPPLGLTPKSIWERGIKIDRLEEVKQALIRYISEGLIPNPEWMEEYKKLLEELGNNKNKVA